jgi:hypothetical protein
MATTVPKAFDQFEAKLQPTADQKSMINARRSKAADYLRESFGPSSNMPLVSTKVIGSAGRDTIIRPIDDIDVLAIFEDSAQDLYKSDSRAFLYRVRDALDKYEVKVVGARGQAVRLFYKSAPHVDIVPAVRRTSGGYLIPSGTTDWWFGTHKWMTTDPDEHARWMSERNAALGYNLKPLVRLMKRWNREHSARLRSFHLKVMAASSFSTVGSNRRNASQKFFQWSRDYVSVSDPAGQSGDLSSYMTAQGRRDVRSVLKSSSNRAKQAIEAEDTGDVKEAMRLWRIIYGPEFPSFS